MCRIHIILEAYSSEPTLLIILGMDEGISKDSSSIFLIRLAARKQLTQEGLNDMNSKQLMSIT
jgi:hypothetical protein